MALKSSTFAQIIYSRGCRISCSLSSKIPFCRTVTAPYHQFHKECSFLPFTRQIHRTNNKNNDPPSPSSSSSPLSPDQVPLPSQNLVLEKEQICLDHMVNTYPTTRRFIAIGSGGDDFADAMVFAVESVLQESIPDASVRKRVSSMGRYISINIGPVKVTSRDQVKAVYEAMMKDDRMRYFF